MAIGSSAIASLAYFTALRVDPGGPRERLAVPRARWSPSSSRSAYGNAPDGVVLAGMALVIAGVAVVSIAPARAAARAGRAARATADVP